MRVSAECPNCGYASIAELRLIPETVYCVGCRQVYLASLGSAPHSTTTMILTTEQQEAFSNG